jgi:hypothetical protein
LEVDVVGMTRGGDVATENVETLDWFDIVAFLLVEVEPSPFLLLEAEAESKTLLAPSSDALEASLWPLETSLLHLGTAATSVAVLEAALSQTDSDSTRYKV